MKHGGHGGTEDTEKSVTGRKAAQRIPFFSVSSLLRVLRVSVLNLLLSIVVHPIAGMTDLPTNRVTRFLSDVAGVSLIIMMLVTVADVLLRNLLDKPIY